MSSLGNNLWGGEDVDGGLSNHAASRDASGGALAGVPAPPFVSRARSSGWVEGTASSRNEDEEREDEEEDDDASKGRRSRSYPRGSSRAAAARSIAEVAEYDGLASRARGGIRGRNRRRGRAAVFRFAHPRGRERAALPVRVIAKRLGGRIA